MERTPEYYLTKGLDMVVNGVAAVIFLCCLAYSGYALATFVACSRLYNNRHWVADVVAGAGFGILSVELAYLTYFPIRNAIARKINMKGSDRLVVAPTLGPTGGGLYLSWKF